MIVVGDTKKLFVMNTEKSELLCELDQAKYELDLHNLNFGFSIKNQQIFCNGKLGEKKYILCHSLKLVSSLDNHLNVICPLLANCLPINASINDRVRILLKSK